MKKLGFTPKNSKTSTKPPAKANSLARKPSLQLPEIPSKTRTKPAKNSRKSLKIHSQNELPALKPPIAFSGNGVPDEEQKESRNTIKNSLLEEEIRKALSQKKPNHFVFDLAARHLHEPESMAVFLEILEKLPKAMKSLTLQIQKNFLDDRELLGIIRQLHRFRGLLGLRVNLEQNCLSGSYISEFYTNLSLFPHLESLQLNLAWAGINDFSLSNLSSSLSSLSSLTDLDLTLDWNSLTLDSLFGFFAGFHCKPLRFLKLSLVHTGFNDPLCEALAHLLEGLPSLLLLRLNLKWNDIADNGLLALLSPIFRASSSLRSLSMNLDNNRVSDLALLALTQRIAFLGQLQDLELRLYDNLIELSYLAFIEEILRKKSLCSAVFHLGKCIFNERQVIVTKSLYTAPLQELRQRMAIRRGRRQRLIALILALWNSSLARLYRREILDEIIEFY